MSATLSSFTVSPHSSAHLRRLCERIADWLQAAASGALPLLARELEETAQRTADVGERTNLSALAARLRTDSTQRGQTMRRFFEERVQRSLDAREGGAQEDVSAPVAGMSPSRMDAAELARIVREHGGAGPARYLARLDHLLTECGAVWPDRLNPLTLEAMALAVHAGLADPGLDWSARLVLCRAANRHFVPVLVEVVEAAERLLAQMGYSDDPPADVRSPAARAALATPDPSIEHPQALVARAERDAAVLGTSVLGGEAPGARLHALPVLHPVLDAERDAVAFAHSVGALPYSREARTGFFANVRTRLREANAPATQVAVVDLVAAMFDYLVHEDEVPLAARPLLWRLQLPVLSLSLLDAGYLGEDPRSLRRLLEHFGAISVDHADEITRGSELHRRLETVVRAIEIVASALQVRSSVMAQQVQKEFARAARSVGQVIEHIAREHRTLEATPGRRNRRNYMRRPGPELEQEVTARVRGMLEERLRRHQPPESVLRFLMDLWLRHLRTAVLRDGEHSAAFQVSLQVVDDLLWSLDEQGRPFSRGELAQRIPPLIRLMTRGVQEIGAKEEDYKAFFDELFLIHLRRMQKRDREHRVAGAGERAGGATGRPTAADASAPHWTQSPPQPQPPPPQLQPESGFAEPPPTASPADPGAPHAATGPSDASSAMPAAADAVVADTLDASSGEHLSGILESLDLGDLPASPVRLQIDAEAAVQRLARGDWIELLTRDGGSSWLKVAWINRRRTVVLLLRHADRRASSLRMDELRDRLARGRAHLIAPDTASTVR